MEPKQDKCMEKHIYTYCGKSAENQRKRKKKYHKQPDKKTAFKGAAVIWTADFSADTVKAQKRNKAVCLLMNTL